MKNIKDEPAILIDGNTPDFYWRQCLYCSDGDIVLGTGRSKEEAEDNAKKERNKYEKFLKQPDISKLKALTNKEMLHDDMEKSIKIITKILIKQLEKKNAKS